MLVCVNVDTGIVCDMASYHASSECSQPSINRRTPESWSIMQPPAYCRPRQVCAVRPLLPSARPTQMAKENHRRRRFRSHIYTKPLFCPSTHGKNVDLITIFLPQTLKERAELLDDGNSSTRCRKANATNINFSNNRSRSLSARLQRPSSDKMAGSSRD